MAAVAMLSLIGTGWLVWGSQPGGSTAQALAAVLGASALGAVALIWVARDARLARTPVATVLLLALVLRLLAAIAWPLLEDDHYRYLWDGMRTVTTGNPYTLAPSAFFGATHLSARWQDVLSGINNPDVPTLYGPVMQGLFALAYSIAPARLGALQGLLVLADMGLLLVLVQHRLPVRWLLAYAVHPLVLKEAIASAHPDGLLALWLVLALLMWQRRCAWGVGLLLGLAVATKVAALVTLPLWLLVGGGGSSFRAQLSWACQLLACMAFALAAVYLPFWFSGGSELQGLAAFGEHWRFNPLAWRLLHTWLPDGLARVTAAALVALGVLGLTWHHWWTHENKNAHRQAQLRPLWQALPPLDAALALLLLLSPVVNAWYWLWALAPSLVLRRSWVAAMAIAASLAYINSSVLPMVWSAGVPAESTQFAVPWPLAAAQILAIAVAAWVDWRNRKIAAS
jgi:alpha-1,6-mannosyltransferase